MQLIKFIVLLGMVGMSIGKIAIEKRYPEIGIENGEAILFVSEVVMIVAVLGLFCCIDCHKEETDRTIANLKKTIRHIMKGRKEERSESDGNNVQSSV